MNYSEQSDQMERSDYVTLPICEHRSNAETTAEVTLSDGQPEIRRVLSVLPTVLPPAKYVSASGVELSGTVDYTVLYVGADGELYSLPASSEYHLTVPLEAAEPDLGAGVCVWADPCVEGVTARVGSPRRMSLRCRLRVLVRAFGKALLEERMVGEGSAEQLFRRMGQTRTLSVMSGLSDVIPLSFELSGMGEDVRVIAANALPVVQEVHAQGEVAHLSGEVMLRLLVAREGGVPEVVSRTLPFAGEMEAEGADAVEFFRATGTVSELSVEVAEGGSIRCELSVLPELRGMSNREISYTADLFSGERECHCEYRSYRLPTAIRCDGRSFSQSERIPLSELSLPEGCVILDAFGSVIFDGCEQVGKKYLLTGEGRYTLLCEKDGEYSATELTLPIRYESEGREEQPESCAAVGSIISCRARTEGELLCLDAEIAVAADFLGCEEISVVREARMGEALPARGCRMTVYYPTGDEDAWSVAKKYHLPPETVVKGKSYYYF